MGDRRIPYRWQSGDYDQSCDVPPVIPEKRIHRDRTGNALKDGFTAIGRRSPLGYPGDIVSEKRADREQDMLDRWADPVFPDA